ncbi:DUF1566 domain-containing protein [bacterium]|nr:DUF1566 domain-containing protein [bacterium]
MQRSTRFTNLTLCTTLFLIFVSSRLFAQYDSTYFIVDSGQQKCYNNTGQMPAPSQGQAFYGQDAQHQGNQPHYVDNGDGTISDLVTGLMWVKARGSKMSWEYAQAGASFCSVGGYNDWRMPTIKELYSLIDFNGKSGTTASNSIPYIDTQYFDFAYGNTALGERIIDCQDWSSTTYVHFTMNNDTTAFGVNFADGRIKGYPKPDPMQGGRKQLYVRYVRGNASYGINNFVDNQDSTITDKATGLMWTQADSRGGMNWEEALAWVQAKNTAQYLGYSDWRLPNAKELQSIVDYTRSPSTSSSAAIDPIFYASSIGGGEYPFYWSSTTHLESAPTSSGGEYAAYVCFGRAPGWMPVPPNSSNYVLMDVHGAGAQRSDPKTGDPANFPYGHGPQGDVVRIYNYVRMVRGGNLRVPVEMSSFRATTFPGSLQVALHWRTESETNNLGFYVERKTAKGSSWERLEEGFVPGQGSTTQSSDYNWTDRVPGEGTWYYRLRQVDTDGSFSYSPSIMAAVSVLPSTLSLSIAPNPVTAGAQIQFSLERDATVTLTVHDLLGKKRVTVLDAAQLSAGWHGMTLQASALPPGMYLCRLSTAAGDQRSIRIVRTH